MYKRETINPQGNLTNHYLFHKLLQNDIFNYLIVILTLPSYVDLNSIIDKLS